MKQYLVRNSRTGAQCGFVMATSASQAMFEANRTFGKGTYIIKEA
jgi:hypothetical protein